MIGYSILDIATHMYGDKATVTTTFLRIYTKGRTFEELWRENKLYVRTDLQAMAASCGFKGKVPTRPEAIKALLIAYAQKHGLPLVKMDGYWKSSTIGESYSLNGGQASTSTPKRSCQR